MKIDGKQMRTIWVVGDGASAGIIDQTQLPHRFATLRLVTLEDAARAIKTMQVRGAPLIGATAAYGVWLALRADASDEALEKACAVLIATRPTAINLKWALDEMLAAVRNRPRSERADAALRRAGEIADEDVAINRAIGRHGLKIIEDIAARKKKGEPVNVLTHCNAGWLATVDVGTATAPIYMAHDKGLPIHVFADETRPRNQGASLTAWELGHHGVPHTVIPDNTGGHLMQHKMVDLVIVGADRVTAQGDVCNKIGTYLKALAAHDNNVPFYVAVPSSSIDFEIADGCRHSDRAARRGRSRDHDRQNQRRPYRDRADRARRLSGRELCFRCHAGAPRHRPDHRARCYRRKSRRACADFSRTRRSPAKLEPQDRLMAFASNSLQVPIDGRQSETALAIARGTARLLHAHGRCVVSELPLPSGRRADLVALDPGGELWIVEIKSSIADFRADQKWQDYRAHCDRLFFATTIDVPCEIFPPDTGLIVADAFGAEFECEAPEHKLPAATRKSMMLLFARAAAMRLQSLADPTGPYWDAE